MLIRLRSRTPDHTLFDPEHDLDLVVMANNARTPTELRAVERMGHARLRARRGALEANAATAARRSSVRRRLRRRP